VIATDVVKDMEGMQEPQESDRDAFCRMGSKVDLLVILRSGQEYVASRSTQAASWRSLCIRNFNFDPHRRPTG